MQKISVLGFFLLCCFAAAWAQPRYNNPYSRYGLGEPQSLRFASQLGMGRLGAAFHDPYQLNVANPAAAAWLYSTAFEVGMNAKRSQFEAANGSSLTQWTGNLAYLNLGMNLKSPINRALDKQQSPWHYGMSVGILPFSDVGYNINTSETLPNLGLVNRNFQGSGGTYELRWSGSARHNQTSAGLKLGWVFGKNSYRSTTIFPDSLSTFQNNFRDDYTVGGLTYELGVMHDFVLSRRADQADLVEKWITVGLHGHGNQNLNTRAESLRLRSRGELSNGGFLSADTLSFVTDQEGKLVLPAEFALGLMYQELNKWKIGAEIGFGAWSKYKNDARPETFQNTLSLSGGLQYTPDFQSYNSYIRRMQYSLGGYYRKDPRIVNGEGITDLGVTFGLGLPILLPRQQTSFVNTAFEIGQLGGGTAIKETYFRMTLGFTMNDNSWFFKRRFE